MRVMPSAFPVNRRDVIQVKEPRYKKYIVRSTAYQAQDEENQCNIGDTVEIQESKPISKMKRWVVTRVVEKAVEV